MAMCVSKTRAKQEQNKSKTRAVKAKEKKGHELN